MFANAVDFVIFPLNTDTRRLAALGADEHNIRNIDRSLEFNDAWRQGPALSLYLALVLFADVYTLNNHAPLTWHNFYHLGAFAFIIKASAYHFYHITFSNL